MSHSSPQFSLLMSTHSLCPRLAPLIPHPPRPTKTRRHQTSTMMPTTTALSHQPAWDSRRDFLNILRKCRSINRRCRNDDWSTVAFTTKLFFAQRCNRTAATITINHHPYDSSNTTINLSHPSRRRILTSWALRNRSSPPHRRLLHGCCHYHKFVVIYRCSQIHSEHTCLWQDSHHIFPNYTRFDSRSNAVCWFGWNCQKVSGFNHDFQP